MARTSGPDRLHLYPSPSQVPDRQVTTPKLELLKLTPNLLGAFFIWIIYAIGARLIPDPENATDASSQPSTSENLYLTFLGIFCSCSNLSPRCHGSTGLINCAGSALSSAVLFSSPNGVSHLVCHMISYHVQPLDLLMR